MRKGLKFFGEPGYAAVKKEMQQLHDRKVMQPVIRKDLSPSQKKEALGYLMFLKKKRCGTIKGRGCADGQKQRAYITKEESTSPTISTEAVFLTAVIDAWETVRSQYWTCWGHLCRWTWMSWSTSGSKGKWLTHSWKLTMTYTQVTYPGRTGGK